MDTIYAPATAVGRAGVAVIRVSGHGARAAVEKLAGPLPSEGRRLCRLVDAQGDLLDEALILTFPAGRSFTGDEVVELHTHGAPVVVRSVCAELGRNKSLRPAEAGEFSRRAFEAGRLDLAQVEGLADLLEAETELQRKLALRAMAGALSDQVEIWRKDLIRTAGLIEATIDFADEDVPVDVAPEVGELLESLVRSFQRELERVDAALVIRNGFEVAIVGAPNVGKSTLLNHLAGRQAAITSEIAGTTRDVIEVQMEIGGLPVTLLDTAGLRSTDDPIETIGVERAVQRARDADLRIFLTEGDDLSSDLLEEDDIVLNAKQDSGAAPNGVSGLTGNGVPELLARIAGVLEGRSADAGLLSRERHRVAMVLALDALRRANDMLGTISSTPDLVAEEVRTALRSIESLVGRIDVEHVLGEIFSSFCIGK